MTATFSKVSMLLDSASEAVDRAQRRHRNGVAADHRLLQTLDPDELDRFVQAGTWVSASDGDVIARQGDPVDAVTFIIDGNAREEVSGIGAGACRAVMGFLGPGEDVGLLSLIDGAPHHCSVVAMRRLQALRLPLDEVARYFRRHPEWYRALTEMAVARLRAHTLWLQALV
jgi:CRP-like cAMP-binding protein